MPAFQTGLILKKEACFDNYNKSCFDFIDILRIMEDEKPWI